MYDIILKNCCIVNENKIIESDIAIKNQRVENGYVRPVAWRGSEMMAISAQQTKIHVAIATWEWGSYCLLYTSDAADE